MAKLKLCPNPTFSATVKIPVAGDSEAEVSFVFKHRTRDEMDAFMKAAKSLKDAELIMEMASGWDLVEAFTAENLNTLVQNYITAPQAIFQTYLDELIKARLKN